MDEQGTPVGGQQQTTPPGMPPVVGSNSIVMGVLAYLGILIIVSYLVAKDDPFVKFHIKQGLVLICIEVIVWVLSGIFFMGLWVLIPVIHIVVIILAVIGIANALRHKQNELPFVGQFAKYFTF